MTQILEVQAFQRDMLKTSVRANIPSIALLPRKREYSLQIRLKQSSPFMVQLFQWKANFYGFILSHFLNQMAFSHTSEKTNMV